MIPAELRPPPGVERRKWYREVYLHSDHWRQTRRAALKRAGNRCVICNAKGMLDVHHRTYERLGAEDQGDLTVLCRDCHDRHHGSLATQPSGVTPAAPPPGKKRKLSKSQKRKLRAGQRGDTLAKSLASMNARNAGRPLPALNLAADAARAIEVEISAQQAVAARKAARAAHMKTAFRPSVDGGFPLKVVREDGSVDLPADRSRPVSSRPAGATGRRGRRSTRQ